MTHLLRVALPDIPGSLGAVATALGMAGANIEAIEIVEHRADGTAIDDVFLDFSPGVMPDMVVSAVQRLEGVHVIWVSRYAAGGNLHLDLEAIEVIAQEPARAMHRLIEVLPHTFRSDWAMVVGHTGDRAVRLTATPECASCAGGDGVVVPAAARLPAGDRPVLGGLGGQRGGRRTRRGSRPDRHVRAPRRTRDPGQRARPAQPPRCIGRLDRDHRRRVVVRLNRLHRR